MTLAFLLFFIFLGSIFRLGRRRSRISYIYSEYRRNSFFDDDRSENYEPFAMRINAFFRRRKALSTSKVYISRFNNIYKLQNNSVTFEYDSKEKEVKCIDRTVKGRSFTVDWVEQDDFDFYSSNNIFERTFDGVCASFNEKSTFNGIYNVYKKRFKINLKNSVKKNTENNIPDKKPIPSSNQTEDYYKVSKNNNSMATIESIEKLDINSATIEQIAALPGINIILAKKIVKYRDEHQGFITVEELYCKMNIKEHFVKQLDFLICADEYKKSDAKLTSNDRIIDL